MNTIRSLRIGAHILGAISKSKQASILGLSSKGIFLLVNKRHVALITTEPYASPLTINIDSYQDLEKCLVNNDTVEITKGDIYFNRIGLKIINTTAKRWVPPEPAPVNTDYRAIQKRIEYLLLDLEPEITRSEFLEVVRSNYLTGADDRSSVLIQKIHRLHHVLSSNDTIKSIEAILPFIGLGQGLTPSGDDFIAGLLLIFNRWKSVFQVDIDLKEMNAAIINHAKTATSLLSANLIELATKGQADERIIDLLDYLITGNKISHNLSKDLLSYGNTSGMEVLAGILAAVSIL